MNLIFLNIVWRLGVAAVILFLISHSTGLLQLFLGVLLFLYISEWNPLKSKSETSCDDCDCGEYYEEEPEDPEIEDPEPEYFGYSISEVKYPRVAFSADDFTNIKQSLLFYMQNSQDQNSIPKMSALHHRLERILHPANPEND